MSYRITIRNNSNDTQSFLLGWDLPRPANADSQVLKHVAQNSSHIQGGQEVTFSFQKEFFAIYGTGRDEGDGSTRVTTSDSRPVTAGSYIVLTTFEDHVSPKWDDQAAQGMRTSARDAFTIKTDNSFQYPNPNKAYIGCGVRSEQGDVVPIQTWPARGGQNVMVYAQAKFFITTGRAQPGTSVEDRSGGKRLYIDFGQDRERQARFVYNPDGSYQPDGQDLSRAGIQWSVRDS